MIRLSQLADSKQIAFYDRMLTLLPLKTHGGNSKDSKPHFIEAAQAPNSHPTLRLPNGITCSGVDYTQIQIQPEPGPGPGQA